MQEEKNVSAPQPETPPNSFAFFQNRDCAFFPCHETERPDQFNCLFCYCPLYARGRGCGGNFKYLPGGVKDCSGCLVPHVPENYARITGSYEKIMERMQRMEELGE